jgi:carboxyl-terminal processing protease
MRLERLLAWVLLASILTSVAPNTIAAFVTPSWKIATEAPVRTVEVREGRHQSNEAILTAAALFLTTLAAPVRIQLHVPHHHQSIASIQLARASALSEQQLLVDDVWKEVTRQFVDKTYNGLGETGWRQKRLEAVQKVTNLGPDDSEQVYVTIRTMLKALGDPYTRFLTPDQYEALTATYARNAPSTSAGIGVQLLLDPRSGHVMILNTVTDGPAAKAGILPGDVVVQVDGIDVQSATAEVVAAMCRGEAGTTVTLTIRHDGTTSSQSATTQLTVARAPIQLKSVESSVFRSKDYKIVGLVKITSFAQQETVSKVIQALKDVKDQGASILVLDLRGNAGGYMPAGVEVAQLFLPRQALIMTEWSDRLANSVPYTADGVGADTMDPLYVLVDERTASASEILTAALQDNRRATVVGSAAKTFGKGRIQNVQGPLGDGSGIAITKAKYLTPNGRDIQGVGIVPDFVKTDCEAKVSASTCLEGVL